jgi:MFS family permease
MVLYPVGGYIADRSGRVKLIGYSTFLYSFAHLFFVFANNWQLIALGQFFSQLLLFYMPAMNALESDSLPPGVRGRGFAIIMAVPGAVRIIAPVLGGYIIEWFKATSGLNADAALVRAVRICWTIAFVTGLVVAWIRLRYLRETVTEEDGGQRFSFREIPSMIAPAYRSIMDSVRWMNRSLRFIVILEMFASFFIAMSAPFYVVYAKQIIGLVESQWGLVMFISGLAGIMLAFPLGSATDRYGARKMIMLGMFLVPLLIFSFQYAGGFLGVASILVGISICNNMMIPAFSTIIANTIPKSRRGRLYSLIGERGISINFGNFWGGGFLLFPPAALGAYMGGWVYQADPRLPWIVTSSAILICALLVYFFVHEPDEVQG